MKINEIVEANIQVPKFKTPKLGDRANKIATDIITSPAGQLALQTKGQYDDLTNLDTEIGGVGVSGKVNPFKGRGSIGISNNNWDARAKFNKNGEYDITGNLNLGDKGNFSGSFNQDKDFTAKYTNSDVAGGNLGVSLNNNELGAEYNTSALGGAVGATATANRNGNAKFRIGFNKKF
jgi:hypothetical protein